jgi:DNA-binding transcriptional LysR family regulator
MATTLLYFEKPAAAGAQAHTFTLRRFTLAPKIELRHLRYFVAVAEELNFTRAAARLNIGQPPLSRQIRDLERQLGGELFLRLNRGIKVSAIGQAFYKDAKAILALTERAGLNARLIARGEQGSLQVGFDATSGFHGFVPWIVREYRHQYPQVRLTLREGSPADLMTDLRDGVVDVAFVPRDEKKHDGLQIEDLLEEEMLIALPSGHRLAKRNGIRLQMLSGEPFIMAGRDTGNSIDAASSACKLAGFVPRVVQEVPQIASAVNLVATGIGVAIVPDCMRHLQPQGVVFRKIEGPCPVSGMSLAYRLSRASTIQERFVSMVTGAAAKAF